MHVGIGSDLLLLGAGLLAGSIGALAGIGGGIIVVPALSVGFGYDIRTAVAASLVGVVATSTAAGMSYAREGLTNVRLGLTLEMATTVGGVVGGLVAVSVAPGVISGIFSVVMAGVAVLMWWHREDRAPSSVFGSSPAAGSDTSVLSGGYFDQVEGRRVEYDPRHLATGLSLSSVAGLLSGLLGVGGGFLKVPTMNVGMGVPTKAAAATSNFMVGITAIASLVIYLARGFVELEITVPLTLGIAVGAVVGSLLTTRVSGRLVQRVLSVILAVVAVQMALAAGGVSLRG